MGWHERDEIPEVVLCWDCNANVRAAMVAAESDEQKQPQLERVVAKLKRLALKRRCKRAYL